MYYEFAIKVATRDAWRLTTVHAQRALGLNSIGNGSVVVSTHEQAVIEMWTQALRAAGCQYELVAPQIRQPKTSDSLSGYAVEEDHRWEREQS